MSIEYNTFWPELYHHGVLGMKWGVRRYQNADGSLTATGKNRYRVGRVSVSTKNKLGADYTDSQKAKMKKNAVQILETQRTRNEIRAATYNKAAEKKERKASSTDITEKKEKYLTKATSNRASAERFLNQANYSSKKLSEIKNEMIKAGKDYVTNTAYSTNLLLDAVGLINVQRTKSITYK